jgi:hypothetical protein
MALKQSIMTLILLLVLCGCSPAGSSAAAVNIEKQAAQQATAIIQSAQATASAINQSSSAPTANPLEPLNPATTSSQTIPTPAKTGQSDQKFALLGVGLAGEGGFVVVNFTAPPDLAHRLLIPGAAMVINEKTGFTYSQVPVMDTIGPLISIPKANGRKGYVMLVIPAQSPLKKGDLVTVILADLKQQHVVVQ